MPRLENASEILELIKSQKDILVDNPNMEMDLVLRNLSCEVIKELAKHFEPRFDWDETIMQPNEVSPYFRFSKRINERLFIEFRTASLASSITFN